MTFEVEYEIRYKGTMDVKARNINDAREVAYDLLYEDTKAYRDEENKHIFVTDVQECVE